MLKLYISCFESRVDPDQLASEKPDQLASEKPDDQDPLFTNLLVNIDTWANCTTIGEFCLSLRL